MFHSRGSAKSDGQRRSATSSRRRLPPSPAPSGAVPRRGDPSVRFFDRSIISPAPSVLPLSLAGMTTARVFARERFLAERQKHCYRQFMPAINQAHPVLRNAPAAERPCAEEARVKNKNGPRAGCNPLKSPVSDERIARKSKSIEPPENRLSCGATGSSCVGLRKSKLLRARRRAGASAAPFVSPAQMSSDVDAVIARANLPQRPPRAASSSAAAGRQTWRRPPSGRRRRAERPAM